jgi:hypothetical protein
MASSICNGMPRTRASDAQRVTELSECFPLPGQAQVSEPQAVVHHAIHGGLALIAKRTRFADEALRLERTTP